MLVLGAVVVAVLSSAPAGESVDAEAVSTSARKETAYPLRRYSWIPAAAGSVSLGLGAAMFFSSANARKHFAAGVTPPGSIEAFIEHNVALERGGLVLAGLGVAGLAAGAVMFLLPEPSRPAISVAASSDGFAFSFTGSLP